MKFIFWFSLISIIYTYAGYIVCIVLLASFFNSKVKSSDIEPSVSLLITAYNEEKDIADKLLNCFELDYPKDKLEIVVASDASTDNTDTIIKKYTVNDSGIRVLLHRVEGRLGKTAVQNSAVQVCSGEIIVFSDAHSLYDRGAIRAMVRNYADPSVGAVSGMYKYINKKDTPIGAATIVFWNIENFIKRMQTRIRTITGCCGCIYSVRKLLYTALPSDIISDLVEPLTILQKGYRIVFEPHALAYEEPTEKSKDEMKMRIRVIVRGMNGMLYVKNLFNVFRYPFVALQLFSHKVLRWLVPFFCLLLFFSNASLVHTSLFYTIFFACQIIFYLFAAGGYVLEQRGVHNKICYLPLYFCIVNIASLISIVKVMKKENIVIWQTQR